MIIYFKVLSKYPYDLIMTLSNIHYELISTEPIGHKQ